MTKLDSAEFARLMNEMTNPHGVTIIREEAWGFTYDYDSMIACAVVIDGDELVDIADIFEPEFDPSAPGALDGYRRFSSIEDLIAQTISEIEV